MTVLAWHFPAVIREILTAEAYVEPLSALKEDSGTEVWRVEGDPNVLEKPTVLWKADATRALQEFACWCADCAMEQTREPDPRYKAALEAKRAWMAGECSEHELMVKRNAATDALFDEREKMGGGGVSSIETRMGECVIMACLGIGSPVLWALQCSQKSRRYGWEDQILQNAKLEELLLALEPQKEEQP